MVRSLLAAVLLLRSVHLLRFIGLRVKALCDNGWFVGKIKYYNAVLNEYNKVVFHDKSVDFIRPYEIDGVEVIRSYESYFQLSYSYFQLSHCHSKTSCLSAC